MLGNQKFKLFYFFNNNHILKLMMKRVKKQVQLMKTNFIIEKIKEYWKISIFIK